MAIPVASAKLPAVQLVAASVSLSAPDLAAVKAELALPAYAGLTPVQSIVLLNKTINVSNPVAQGTVPLTTCSVDAFSKFLVGPRAMAATSTVPGIAAKYQAYSDALLPLIANMKTIDLTSTTLETILAEMVADGLITQAQVTEFTTKPDPTWNAILQTTRATQILSAPYIIEVSDVTSALA